MPWPMSTVTISQPPCSPPTDDTSTCRASSSSPWAMMGAMPSSIGTPSTWGMAARCSLPDSIVAGPVMWLTSLTRILYAPAGRDAGTKASSSGSTNSPSSSPSPPVGSDGPPPSSSWPSLSALLACSSSSPGSDSTSRPPTGWLRAMPAKPVAPVSAPSAASSVSAQPARVAKAAAMKMRERVMGSSWIGRCGAGCRRDAWPITGSAGRGELVRGGAKIASRR